MKDDDRSNILIAYDNSARGHINYQCPSCKGWTQLDFERFSAETTSDESANTTARIACQACDTLLDEDQRQVMLAAPRLTIGDQQLDQSGDVIGEDAQCEMVRAINRVVTELSGSTRNATEVIAAAPRFPVPPGSITFGLRWNRFDNPFKPLGETAQSYRAALMQDQSGDAQGLIDFYHEILARQFPRPNRDEETDANRLALRSRESTYERDAVPASALFLTANIDQQKRLLVWLVKAHDRAGRSWIIAWGQEDICGQRVEPTKEQRTEALDRVYAMLNEGFRTANDVIMVPAIKGLDVAEWPDLVAEWARGRPDVMPVHGTGRTQVERMKRGDGHRVEDCFMEGWYDLREQTNHGGSWRILWLDTDNIKHELSRSFARAIDEPGSAMIPLGLDHQSDLIQHLTSERWQKSKKTATKMVWEKVGRYNDHWDNAYVTHALGKYFLAKNPGFDSSPVSSETTGRNHSGGDFGSHMGTW